MIYRFGQCELDDRLYELRRFGRRIRIEPRVFGLIVFLIEERDRVVTRQEILDRLWEGREVSESSLTGAISLARQAVGDDPVRQRILRTHYGRGYRFVADVQVVQPRESTPKPRRAYPFAPGPEGPGR